MATLTPNAQLTSYQKTHRPIKSLEQKCKGVKNSDGMCESCGRYLERNGAHKPAVTGSLGWHHFYADGSERIATPA